MKTNNVMGVGSGFRRSGEWLRRRGSCCLREMGAMGIVHGPHLPCYPQPGVERGWESGWTLAGSPKPEWCVCPRCVCRSALVPVCSGQGGRSALDAGIRGVHGPRQEQRGPGWRACAEEGPLGKDE